MCRRSLRLSRLFAALFCLGITSLCLGQASSTATAHPDSRIDIYGGYGYFHPINSGIDGFQFKDISNPNATVSVTGWFNHYVGLQIEGGYLSGNNEHVFAGPCVSEQCDQLIYTAEAGPIFRLPLGPFVPFIHTLGGGVRDNGPAFQHLMWGWGVTGGAGFDYILPFFKDHVAVRPIQADFQYSQVVYGPLVLPVGKTGGFAEIDALKLSGGLVLRFGKTVDKLPVRLGCSTDPVSGYPGDIIHVAASTLNLNPKKPIIFTWQANGGKVTPSGGTATIDTTHLAPGEYVIQGRVQQGLRAREQAICTTPFTIRPFEPPTLTCAATPATAVTGTSINISTVGTSPQNRGLTYSYSSSAGELTATGPTATLSTNGVGVATVVITCNVTDDLGKSATATTEVSLTAPSLPVLPHTTQLCSIGFDRDRRRSARVDNEAKGCLDDIALTLNQQTTAKLVMVGNTSPEERPEKAAERTLNARQYLVDEKGIDPSRIELRVGETSGRSVNNILVPPGATFADANTATFDEHTILRHGQAYGTPYRPGVHLEPHHPKHSHATKPAATAPSPAPQH